MDKYSKIGLIVLIVTVGCGATALFLMSSLVVSIQASKADHYQKDIAALETSSDDCQHWTDYLKSQYWVRGQADPDFYNYLAHVYNHVKFLGCSPIPESNPTIQDFYK